MNLSRLSLLLLVFGLVACGTSDTPHEETAETPAETEPSGYNLVGAETEMHFVIVSNSAGPVTVRFPGGLSGELSEDGTGKVDVQLDKMYSLDQNKLENPLRDANVVEAFFGVRPSAVFPEKVDEAWSKLSGMIERNVATATFEITASPGLMGDADTGSLDGKLELWNTIEVPLSLPVSIARTGDRIEVSSTEPVSFDLEEVLGSELRKLTFDTMLAAGCAHQPGIQNKVEITIDKAVFAAR